MTFSGDELLKYLEETSLGRLVQFRPKLLERIGEVIHLCSSKC
jgi:hypothetical protein